MVATEGVSQGVRRIFLFTYTLFLNMPGLVLPQGFLKSA